MELTLVYRGQLPANGSLKEKQAIRRAFHIQLKELWKEAPFKPSSESFYKQIGPFNFVPLICKARDEIAELQITMLRSGPAGAIITQSGDIDNRLKTLFDSLRLPKEDNDLPTGDVPTEEENPFFCLLEDDNLITRLSVSTDRLLEPCNEKSYVSLLIHVIGKKIEPRWGHMIITLG